MTMGTIEPLGKLVHNADSESAPRVQDRATFVFQKFRNLLRFVRLHADFCQCFTKVVQKAVEMPVIQSLFSRVRVH
jgi:hypothetical protein